MVPYIGYHDAVFPFDRPSGYSEMLNKIGIFTFLITLGLTWFVGHSSATAYSFLRSNATTVEILTLKVPLLYAAPAVITATFTRIIRLHDKLSDLFGIRARFDIYRILVPLCGSLEIPVDPEFRTKLQTRRGGAMERTFYAYASFEDPKISKALVFAAIDVWTWYWILLEGAAILAVADIVLVSLKAYGGATFACALLVLAILLFATHFDVCGRLADAQIEEIVANVERANALRTEFTRICAHT